MTPEQFCYWLRGFHELAGDKPPTGQQWSVISKHLEAVFVNVTSEPSAPADKSAEKPVESPAAAMPLKLEDVLKEMDEVARRAVNRGPVRIC